MAVTPSANGWYKLGVWGGGELYLNECAEERDYIIGGFSELNGCILPVCHRSHIEHAPVFNAKCFVHTVHYKNVVYSINVV